MQVTPETNRYEVAACRRGSDRAKPELHDANLPQEEVREARRRQQGHPAG